MANVEQTRTDPVAQFWDMTDDVSAGMLGVVDGGEHMQPMHPICDPSGHAIWFFAKADSDLAHSLGGGQAAHFCVIGRNHDYHACVAGELAISTDRATVDRFWNPVTAAWFKGKDDPALTLIKLSLRDGVAWSSVGGAKFGWEIAKANLTDAEPDVGARQHFSFSSKLDAKVDKFEAMAIASGMGGNPAVPRADGQV